MVGCYGIRFDNTYGAEPQDIKRTRCSPLTKLGTSVRWYTELKPTPKRPVLPTCQRERERERERAKSNKHWVHTGARRCLSKLSRHL